MQKQQQQQQQQQHQQTFNTCYSSSQPREKILF